MYFIIVCVYCIFLIRKLLVITVEKIFTRHHHCRSICGDDLDGEHLSIVQTTWSGRKLVLPKTANRFEHKGEKAGPQYGCPVFLCHDIIPYVTVAPLFNSTSFTRSESASTHTHLDEMAQAEGTWQGSNEKYTLWRDLEFTYVSKIDLRLTKYAHNLNSIYFNYKRIVSK